MDFMNKSKMLFTLWLNLIMGCVDFEFWVKIEIFSLKTSKNFDLIKALAVFVFSLVQSVPIREEPDVRDWVSREEVPRGS